MNLSVLDLGSNSFHLLLAELTTEGQLTKRASHQREVPLGADLACSGSIGSASWRAAMAAVDELMIPMRAAAGRGVVVATSAIREAANGAAFAHAVEQRHGLTVEVLSGAEEALLSYSGARRAVPEVQGTAVVLDVGGGSVELAVGDDAETCGWCETLPLGVQRLKSALGLPLGPLSQEGIASLRDLVRLIAAPAAHAVRALGPKAVIFSAGTARALAKLAKGTPVSTPSRRLPRAELVSLADDLSRRQPRELLTLGLGGERARSIAAGAWIVAHLADLLSAQEIIISPWALREGVAYREVLRERARTPFVSQWRMPPRRMRPRFSAAAGTP